MKEGFVFVDEFVTEIRWDAKISALTSDAPCSWGTATGG
jgi:hypothetical protein